ncbi:hypothetical protein OMW55_09625 [Sphingomonas sp. BN140010]|uniref:SnoaL-like domain-containing protein n=1 Tax=Sphingomonas arvum TaxID=2992113 RepID=A0ABT3JGD4_9SPHN|nr:hypothetical protein [Sphingomonas sp. BN140010]MCW3798061.1 hypothetical protein [Sphingomonas sp. BN140010]
MTYFRLEIFDCDTLVNTEAVDGIEVRELAIKLLTADCPAKMCKLFAEDVLVAQRVEGSWSCSAEDLQFLTKESKSAGSMLAGAAV